MAANKFATMLQKNCHKMTVILVYAVLEWILILLLLLNSLFSFLITKFAKFFGLKPSCTWCSSLDHHNFTSKNSYFDHVCEAHATEISNMSYCSTHNKLAEAKNLCIHCWSSRPPRDGAVVSSTAAFCTWMTGGEGDDDNSRCSCCDQIFNRPVYPHHSMTMSKNSLDFILEYFQKNKIMTDDDDHKRKKAEIVEECVSNLEVQELDSLQTSDDPFSNLGCNEDDDELLDSDRFICIELINTDIAAADDVDSPSKPTGEDEEQLENLGARSRDQIDDVEALKTKIEAQEKALKELYAERRAAAEEKAAMQMEAAQYQRMMEEQAEYDQEALLLLNDLMLKREREKRELEKELEMIRRRSTSIDHDLDIDDDEGGGGHVITNSNISDISLAEFDEERVSILEEVKALEAKIFPLEDAVAKKLLLPLFDAAETDDGDDKVMMQEELGHVYERLQALEADKDFLEHCIRSMMKGSEGMGLLQEILQHLRDLKSVELSARNMAQMPLPDASMEKED